MKVAQSSMRRNQLFWAIIGSAAVLGVTLAWAIGMQQSVWFDEAYSVVVAKQPADEIIRLASLDTHPPLYYLILHWWGDAFGWQVWALRLLSALAFGGSIVVASILTRRLFGTRAAVLTSVAVLLSPLLLRYGFEIRMYAIASLIGIAATYILVRAEATSSIKAARLWWASYAVMVALGVYVLYYLALLWCAHLLWLIASSRKKQWRERKWVWAFIGSVVMYVPWLPTFLQQTHNGALASIGQPMNAENTLGVLSFTTLYQPLWQLDIIHSMVYFALIILTGYWIYRALHSASMRHKYWWLLVLYSVVPVVVLMGVSFFRPMYVERYLSHIAIGLIMLLAVSASVASRGRRKFRYWPAATLIAILLIGTAQLIQVGNFNFQRMSRPHVDEIAAHLEDCRTDTAVVAADPYVAIELSAYMPKECPIYFYSSDHELRGGYAPLNHSAYQLKEQTVSSAVKQIRYVYYDQPQLTFDGYRRTGEVRAESLTLAWYQR